MPKRLNPNKPSKTDAAQVRIIAGQYRGRRLPVLSVDGLRPTGDRVRETLFNWLQNDVPGARCLDAFAGTGALGFEAASRWADSVTLVESNRTVAESLEKTRQTLLADQVQVVNLAFEAFLASQPELFDVVFLDPPFHETDFRSVLDSVKSVLAPNALVYLESPKTLGDWQNLVPVEWEISRDKFFGEVHARLCVAGA